MVQLPKFPACINLVNEGGRTLFYVACAYSKGNIQSNREKIRTCSFFAWIDSTKSLEPPKSFFKLNSLGNTQGGHAHFRAWEFYRKISIFILFHNYGVIILYYHVFWHEESIESGFEGFRLSVLELRTHAYHTCDKFITKISLLDILYHFWHIFTQKTFFPAWKIVWKAIKSGTNIPFNVLDKLKYMQHIPNSTEVSLINI